MRLPSVFLAAVVLIPSFVLAQHSSGGGSSSGSSGGSSSGSASAGGSHASSLAGSGYSGGSSGGSHSSGSGYGSSGGSSHSAGMSHSSGSHGSSGVNSSGGTHASGAGHVSGGASVSNGSVSSKTEHGSALVSTSHNGIEPSSSKMARPIREPKSGVSEHAIVPEKRGFFSFLRHPFRKPEPKIVQAKQALYLPRPICPKGRCAPACPVGQVRSSGACTAPIIPICTTGQGWNTAACSYNSRYHCSLGQIWNGNACVYGTHFLDNCIGSRMALNRQAQRVQNSEAARQRACASGPGQECSEASATWQSEESLRQNLLRRYQQCQMQSMPLYSSQYGWPYDSTRWFDPLQFNLDY